MSKAETRFSRANVEAITMEHTRSAAGHQPFQGDSRSMRVRRIHQLTGLISVVI